MDTLTLFLSIGVPTFSAMAAYFIKTLMNRIESLETQMVFKTDDKDVRQVLADKLDPITKTLEDIKLQNQKLYDLYINLVSKNNDRQ